MKISIYGCGWLGWPLAKSFINQGFRVKATVRSEDSLVNLKGINGLTVYQSSMDEIDKLDQDFWSCDVLIIAVPHKVVEDFENLCSIIRQEQIDKVIYVSSTSVYANNNDWVNEKDGPYNEDSVIYQIEQVFDWMGINAAFVRFSGLVGPNRHPGRFFAKSGRPVRQSDTAVNLVHLSDCIGIIQAVIDQDKFGKAFNGCSPDHPIKKDFYSWAVNDFGEALPDFQVAEEPAFKKVDGRLVERELNYNYQVRDFKKTQLYLHVGRFSSTTTGACN